MTTLPHYILLYLSYIHLLYSCYTIVAMISLPHTLNHRVPTLYPTPTLSTIGIRMRDCIKPGNRRSVGGWRTWTFVGHHRFGSFFVQVWGLKPWFWFEQWILFGAQTMILVRTMDTFLGLKRSFWWKKMDFLHCKSWQIWVAQSSHDGGAGYQDGRTGAGLAAGFWAKGRHTWWIPMWAAAKL